MGEDTARFDSVDSQLFVVERRFADLTDSELEQVIPAFDGAGDFRRVVSTSNRPMSAAAVVETTRGSFFVKRHAAFLRGVADLVPEHEFARHLGERGIAVPRTLRTLAGEVAWEGVLGTYEVHETAAGDDLYRGRHTWSPFLDRSHAYAAGRQLAALHVAARGFARDARPVGLLESRFDLFAAQDIDAALQSWLDKRPTVADFLDGLPLSEDLETHREFAARLHPLILGEEPLWTHNDWHATNLFWDATGVSSVIDFGLSGKTIALYDLAVAIERNTFLWLNILSGQPDDVRLEEAVEIVSGYHSLRPLSDRQLEALAALLPLVQAEAGLSAIAYYSAIGDEASAKWSYDVMFGEHTRWFTTARGREVLGEFRRRTIDSTTALSRS